MRDGVLKVVLYEGRKADLEVWWEGQRGEALVPGEFAPGLTVEDRRLDDETAAWQAVRESHQAGQPARAVSFYASTTDSAGTRKLRRQVARLEERVQRVLTHGLKSLKEGVSGLVGCPNCKSRIARARVTEVRCPVCRGEILSLRRREKVAALREQIGQVRQELEACRPVPNKTGGYRWAVGGWVTGGTPEA